MDKEYLMCLFVSLTFVASFSDNIFGFPHYCIDAIPVTTKVTLQQVVTLKKHRRKQLLENDMLD